MNGRELGGACAPANTLSLSDFWVRFVGEAETVLHRVSFSVGAGQILGLVGFRGSGKTTLLEALFLHESKKADRSAGFAASSVSLHRQLTVAENLEHFARLRTGSWHVAKMVVMSVNEFGLQPIANTRCRQLSAGQQKMVHLACSFVHEPTVRLLDEPLLGLDDAQRSMLRDVLRSWSKRLSITILTFSEETHLEDLCTHGSMLLNGTVASLDGFDRSWQRRLLGNSHST